MTESAAPIFECPSSSVILMSSIGLDCLNENFLFLRSVPEKKQKERKEVKAKKKAKTEDGPEVVIINEDSIHGRPDKMAGRVKVAFFQMSRAWKQIRTVHCTNISYQL